MPGLDRSGPMGSGPMTGGRRGLFGNAGSDYAMQDSLAAVLKRITELENNNN